MHRVAGGALLGDYGLREVELPDDPVGFVGDSNKKPDIRFLKSASRFCIAAAGGGGRRGPMLGLTTLESLAQLESAIALSSENAISFVVFMLKVLLMFAIRVGDYRGMVLFELARPRGGLVLRVAIGEQMLVEGRMQLGQAQRLDTAPASKREDHGGDGEHQVWAGGSADPLEDEGHGSGSVRCFMPTPAPMPNSKPPMPMPKACTSKACSVLKITLM